MSQDQKKLGFLVFVITRNMTSDYAVVASVIVLVLLNILLNM